jgi:hypothetical protein
VEEARGARLQAHEGPHGRVRLEAARGALVAWTEDDDNDGSEQRRMGCIKVTIRLSCSSTSGPAVEATKGSSRRQLPRGD